MKLNIYANLGGYGGYQILSEHIIHALKNTMNSNIIENINLFTIRTSETRDPILKRMLRVSGEMNNKFADVSLAIATPEHAIHFTGKKRILYPMHEGTKLQNKVVKKLNLLDEIWVSSTFNKNTFFYSGVEESKLRLLHGGVNTDLFYPLIKENKHLTTCRLLGLKPYSKEKPFTFLQVGKYENRKASFETIHGFLDAMEDYPVLDQVQLKVKWSSSVATKSLSQIKNELTPLFLRYPKAAQRIHIVKGNDVDMLELYNDTDCLLFPSRSEGIGLPILEAMACGLPCITTDYGSLSDYICRESNLVLTNHGLEGIKDPFYGLTEEEHGQWGIVKFKDISNAILDVLEMTPNILYEKSLIGRQHVESNFSHLKTGQNILKLLEV